MTILEHVRTITGTTATDVSDAAVASFMLRHKIVLHERVVWLSDTTARVAVRGFVDSPAGTVPGSVRLLDKEDAEVSGWTITLDGDITFDAAHVPPRPRLHLCGHSYDVNTVGADVLDAFAAKLGREFDFSTDGQSFKRSQQAAAASVAADKLRAQGIVQLVRANDLRDDELDPAEYVPDRREDRWRRRRGL